MGRATHVWASALALCAAMADARADEPSSELQRLSLEELMNVHVRSASLTSVRVPSALVQ